MPSRWQNHRFAPEGRIGFGRIEDTLKASLFGVPQDEDYKKVRERSLRHADKALDESCAVSELHFEHQYIICDYIHAIEGAQVHMESCCCQKMLFLLFLKISRDTCEKLRQNQETRNKNGATTRNKNSRNTTSCDPSESLPATHANEATQGATISLELQCSLVLLLRLKTPSKY